MTDPDQIVPEWVRCVVVNCTSTREITLHLPGKYVLAVDVPTTILVTGFDCVEEYDRSLDPYRLFCTDRSVYTCEWIDLDRNERMTTILHNAIDTCPADRHSTVYVLEVFEELGYQLHEVMPWVEIYCDEAGTVTGLIDE